MLTTHRIILILNSNVAFSFRLSLIKKIEDIPTQDKSYRVKIILHPAKYPSPFRSDAEYIIVDYKKPDFKEVLDRIAKETQSHTHSSSFELSHVGIGGIERARKAQFEEDGQTMNAAFSDLKNLMELASTMTDLSRSLSAKLDAKTASQEKDSSTVAFRSMLLSIGIDNPVTRGVSNYHSELSQQIHDFLFPLVEKVGGVMSLTEAYCYYNRARSMSLISPQDMVLAIENFASLPKQKLFFKKFSSGSSVVQSNCRDNKAVLQQVGEDVKKALKVSVEGYAGITRIPVFLARERLKEAEDEGIICRDESEEGVQFYFNIF